MVMSSTQLESKPAARIWKVTLLYTVLLSCCVGTSFGQYKAPSELFNELYAKKQADLREILERHPDLYHMYYPMQFSLPMDYYILDVKKGTTVFKADYYVNVIFDPCREYGFNCCNDTYGAPEFRALDDDPDSPTLGNWIVSGQDGAIPAPETSRWPDDSTEYNPRCINLMDPFEFCVAPLTARSPAPKRPKCWNYNATVVANQNCRAPFDGVALPYCLEVGITSTAFIPECSDKSATDCGTFLEVHQPGDPTILTEVKLQGQYVSGYKMAVISLTHQRSGSRILCEGDHEIWWVHRTKWSWIVEKRLPFRIVSPECDWNFNHNRYDPWATIGPEMVDLSAPTPFLPEKRVYSRTRVVGKPGFPGKGMGGTLIAARPDEFHPLAQFIYGNDYTYSFRPERIDHAMPDGELYPTHFAYTTRYGSFRKLNGAPTLLQTTEVADVFANKPPTLQLGAQTIAVRLKANINRQVQHLRGDIEQQQADQLAKARREKAFGQQVVPLNLTSDQFPVQLDTENAALQRRAERAERLAQGVPSAPVNSKV